MHIEDFLTFSKLSAKRLRSEFDYRKFQAFQAKLLLDYLADNGININGMKLLDLGSGIGGYAQIFASQGAEVYCLDINIPSIEHINLSQVLGDALALPFYSNYFNFVFCASLIEHVSDPKRLLEEIERVLKPGGVIYISFPPYFSPRGGHEYSPYHYLGERIALHLVRRYKKIPAWAVECYHPQEYPKSFKDLYRGWGLYRMTIRKFRGLIRATNLKVLNMSSRYCAVSVIKWPILNELLTWHAQFLLEKRLDNTR